jgi:hypothetical protein
MRKFLGKIWEWVKPYWTRKMIPFLLISWIITNGWCYAFIALGPVLHIPWMTRVGLAWAAILWMPWSLEKPFITLPLAGLLYRIVYKEKFNKKE